MATQGNITLATRIFAPAGVQNGLGTWRYVDDAVFNGVSSATASVRGPSRDGIFRVQLKLDTPRVKSSDSPCGCAGDLIDTGTSRIETIFPRAWTKSMRTEHYQRLKDLIDVAMSQLAHEDLEGPW